jgi:TetR/AcrR family transcriptional repressor of nem operon
MAPKGKEARMKLLDAARDVIRRQGYSATTVDDICAAAGVSKGAFFHHFASKEEAGVAAIEAFGAMADAIFASAPFAADPDPRARIFGYVDFRAAMLDRSLVEFTCLMGTTVQEVYETHPALREACNKGMSSHVADLERDLAAAKELYAKSASWSPRTVGYFIQATLQGAFIFAKAKHDSEIARDCLGELRSHLVTLLGQPETKPTEAKPKKEELQ